MAHFFKKIISTAIFTLIDIFKNSPILNNLFGLLMKINYLLRTFINRPI